MASLQYEKIDRGVWLFHKDKAPAGKKMSSDAARQLENTDGWVDSPAKFGVITAKAADTQMAQVEKAVADEKQSFIESAASALAEGKPVEYNAVFDQLTAKELQSFVTGTGLAEKLDIRKGIEILRKDVKQLISDYNNSLGE